MTNYMHLATLRGDREDSCVMTKNDLLPHPNVLPFCVPINNWLDIITPAS